MSEIKNLAIRKLQSRVLELEDENYSLRLSLTSGGGRPSSASVVFDIMKKRIKLLERVRESAESLSNEVSGMLGLAEHEIQRAIGNTNVQCVRNRLNETKEALKTARSGDE